MEMRGEFAAGRRRKRRQIFAASQRFISLEWNGKMASTWHGRYLHLTTSKHLSILKEEKMKERDNHYRHVTSCLPHQTRLGHREAPFSVRGSPKRGPTFSIPRPVSCLLKVDEPLACNTCSTLGRLILTPAVPLLQQVAPVSIEWRESKILCKIVWACRVHCWVFLDMARKTVESRVAGPIGRPNGSRDSESSIESKNDVAVGLPWPSIGRWTRN